MGLKEDRAYIKKRKEDMIALRKDAINREKKALNESIIKREDERALREASLDNYYDYKDNVKKTLVKKALMEIYTGSLFAPSSNEKFICENLVEQYIGENGVSKILRNMKRSKNNLLREIAEKTDEYSKKITSDATVEDPDSQVIKTTDVEDFWKDIDNSEDIEDITNTIRLRVSNAEEEFVNKNQEDKEDIKTILQNTASRINNSKSHYDNDYTEAVEESENRIAKEQIYNIQHNRKRNVFDRMVRNLSEIALKNPDAKKAFVRGGHLDVESIVESVRCMYTLLEVVNTIQLEKVDSEYIENTIKSMK